ncbi:response regulator [Actinoplanes sp. L3-i22]|uniref:response regulator n=1 Tax=Actinoplanes sp. L3-i22 TaxID=2836373 RepID=UPI001C790E25|nr:response regulator [Actinoplanes sp. L3-i22]BCY07981.1 response regulator [Actinoplanes sp. L3-i22]
MTAAILVVEDSAEDVEAIERAISRSHPGARLEFLRSGGEVLPRLAAAGAVPPWLMLLDLNMPGEGGLAVLRQVRADPAWNALRIVVFTSSEDQAEADACFAAGADSYIYKPVNFALFQTVLRQTLDYWGNVAHIVVPPPGDSAAQT